MPDQGLDASSVLSSYAALKTPLFHEAAFTQLSWGKFLSLRDAKLEVGC
jgi:hypothetical protein